MSRFGDRLTHGFDEIAERITPSPSAHADFRARVAQHTPHDEVVVMMAPDNIAPRRPRWVVFTVAVASTALVLAVVGLALLRPETDDMMPSATTIETPTTNVTDDAEAPIASVDCGTFTFDQLNAIVERAQAKAGTDFAVARFDDESLCTQVPRGSNWLLGATWLTPPEQDGLISVRVEAADFSLDAEGWVPPDYRTHPMLDESVRYQGRSFPDVYYPEAMELRADLWVSGGPFVEYGLSIHDPQGSEALTNPDPDPQDEARIQAFEDFGLAIANEMLIDMGWIDGPAADPRR